MRQMEAAGPIFAFELPGGSEQAMAFLNALELVDISNNIGDARSLCCHPWTTTHYGVSPDVRRDMGVDEGLLRINIGLEDPRDVIADLDRALTSVRSEEHTSELQSLMRISYAVFCLKKKQY